MDYVFVLDVSGSMRNRGKLNLSQASIYSFIENLSTEDRFEIITFNDIPETQFGQLTQATTDTHTRAEGDPRFASSSRRNIASARDSVSLSLRRRRPSPERSRSVGRIDGYRGRRPAGRDHSVPPGKLPCFCCGRGQRRESPATSQHGGEGWRFSVLPFARRQFRAASSGVSTETDTSRDRRRQARFRRDSV